MSNSTQIIVSRVEDGTTIQIYKYKPTLLKPFYINMEPLSLLKRVRFLVDLWYGYSVYYLYINEKLVGYCTTTSGKNNRYWFASGDDIMVGPYYIDESFRGLGYAKKMVGLVINECEKSWKTAYLYIKNSNLASIGVAEYHGASLLFHVHNTRTRKLVKDENGEYGVYAIINK